MSILETSHRSKEYDAVNNEAINLVKRLLSLPDDYHVLFLHGGASLQFAMVPMNLLGGDRSADYVITGYWSQKAFKEAKIIGTCRVAASSEDKNFASIPKVLDLDPGARYVHITSNNTTKGTQFSDFPDTGGVPLVADMSSDILWRPFDVRPFGLIYAGAQKNLGPAGVTLVLIRDDILGQCNPDLPTLLKFPTHAKENSIFHTPPVFAIYMVRNVLRWVTGFGGLEGMEKRNRKKGRILYDLIDASDGFYKNPVEKEDRSMMNVVFRLPSDDLEARFIAEGRDAGFIGLKGHRSAGGCRVSMYNATSIGSIRDLAVFMKAFMAKNG